MESKDQSISAEISGVDFSPPLMNSSGPLCTSWSELRALAESSAGAVVLKTATVEPRKGNPEPRVYEFNGCNINSIGFANLGYRKYCELIPRLKRFGKPVVASVGGFCSRDYSRIAEAYSEAGADVLEVNLSCPNLGDFQPPAFNLRFSAEILDFVKDSVSLPIWVKLPPFIDSLYQEKMAAMLLEKKVDAVSCINSVGNSVVLDNAGQFVIKPVWGGLGGEWIKPLALGNIKRYYDYFKGRVKIIGVGGILSGRDVIEHFLVGANAVQLGTAYLSEGAAVFERVEKELLQILSEEKISCLSDLTGKACFREGSS